MRFWIKKSWEKIKLHTPRKERPVLATENVFWKGTFENVFEGASSQGTGRFTRGEVYLLLHSAMQVHPKWQVPIQWKQVLKWERKNHTQRVQFLCVCTPPTTACLFSPFIGNIYFHVRVILASFCCNWLGFCHLGNSGHLKDNSWD